MACAYIKESPDFSIADGNVQMEFVGTDLPPVCFSLRNCRITHAKLGAFLAAHDAKSATVTSIRKRKG